MSRFLFSTAPLPGHIDWGGLLQTAVHLQTAGHEVCWVSGSAIQSQIAAAGIPFHEAPVAYHPPAGSVDLEERGFVDEMGLTLDVWLNETAVAAATNAHLDFITMWQPDVIIADPLVLAAALASEVAGIPLAGCGYPGAFTVISNHSDLKFVAAELAERKQRLRNRFALPPETEEASRTFLFIAPKLHLVYFTESWFAAHNPAPSPGVQYVGGQQQRPQTAAPEWMEQVVGKRPLIAIAQSTTYGTFSRWLPDICDAINQMGAVGILAADAKAAEPLGPLPPNIHIVPWLPYDHLLPHVTAVIHHGGTGTTHRAICHGVPQLILPQVADQFIHAMAVNQHGNGKMLLPWHLSKDAIFNKLKEVVVNQTIHRAAQKLQNQFAQLGGVPQAAHLLISLAQNSNESILTNLEMQR